VILETNGSDTTELQNLISKATLFPYINPGHMHANLWLIACVLKIHLASVAGIDI